MMTGCGGEAASATSGQIAQHGNIPPYLASQRKVTSATGQTAVNDEQGLHTTKWLQ